MQIYSNQLIANLNKALTPIYLIHGDELFLVEQARALIHQHAIKQSFHNKEILTMDTSFKWDQLMQHLHSQSLFADKTIIELRNSKAKFDANGTKLLTEYLNNPSSDHLLIITTNKLTAAQKKARWFKAIDKAGIHIPIYPIKNQDLPRWIQQYMQKFNLTSQRECCDILAIATQGNLAATAQAIEKLSLLYPDAKITIEQMNQVICNNSQFSVFDLANECLAGNHQQVLRALHQLKTSKTETTLVLWAITRELRVLNQLMQQLNQGDHLTEVIKSQWATRKMIVQKALLRLKQADLQQQLLAAQRIDLINKGLMTGHSWNEIEQLCLAMCKQPHLQRDIAHG